MSTTPTIASPCDASKNTSLFAMVGMVTVMLLTATLAGALPIGFSIAIVFLFAGPHNWIEFRYMLGRLPARWGPLRNYFLLGIFGAILLTLTYIALLWTATGYAWSEEVWLTALASWNTCFIGWIVSLALLRSQQNPQRDWLWVIPCSLVAISLTWLWPTLFSLLLVYVHPLLALAFLDLELKRQRATWRKAYRTCLALLPFCLLTLWYMTHALPDLPNDQRLFKQISQHAGGGLLPHISTHLLVATHTFLEMLHYGVWVLVIPFVSQRNWPWQVEQIPLARNSLRLQQLILGCITVGVGIMLVLWMAFLSDYAATRDIYFTLAMFHVLAEIPFLLRLL
jgi:hypothetical protein